MTDQYDKIKCEKRGSIVGTLRNSDKGKVYSVLVRKLGTYWICTPDGRVVYQATVGDGVWHQEIQRHVFPS